MGVTGLLGAGLLAGCDDMSLGLDFVDGPYWYDETPGKPCQPSMSVATRSGR